MKAKHALAVLSLLLCAAPACAEEDFYGIKMRSDLWAWNLVLHTGPRANDAELLDGPVIDHDVYAEAIVRKTVDRTEFMLSVVNNSPAAISTDYDSRDFILHLADGKTVPLIDPVSQAELIEVPSKKSVTFNPSLGNLKLRAEEIRMIEVSFDLGRTRIFLFPASLKKDINAITNPDRLVVPTGEEDTRKKSGGIMDWMKGKKGSKAPSADPGASTARDRVDQAANDFKFKPSPVALPKDPAPGRGVTADAAPVLRRQASAESVRTAAQVIEVNMQYNYVTVNLGARDGLQRDSILNIVRNGRLMARVKVRQLREDVAAALILPEYRKPDIRPGDLVNLG